MYPWSLQDLYFWFLISIVVLHADVFTGRWKKGLTGKCQNNTFCGNGSMDTSIYFHFNYLLYCNYSLYPLLCLTASLVWLCKCKSWKLLIPGCLTLPLGYIIFFTLINLRFSIANLYLTITSSIFRHLEKVSWYLAKLLYFPYHGSNIFPLCHWK